MAADSNMGVDVAFTRSISWEAINWPHHEAVVKKLQVRIAKTMQAGRHRLVKSLQWLLTHSFSAKLLSLSDHSDNCPDEAYHHKRRHRVYPSVLYCRQELFL